MPLCLGLYHKFLAKPAPTRWVGRVLPLCLGLYHKFLAKPAPTRYYFFLAMTYLVHPGLFYYVLPDIHPHLTGEIFKKGTQEYYPEFPLCFASFVQLNRASAAAIRLVNSALVRGACLRRRFL